VPFDPVRIDSKAAVGTLLAESHRSQPDKARTI
jgi:hypothetical protein